MRVRLLITDPDPVFAKEIGAEFDLVKEVELVGAESVWGNVEKSISANNPDAVMFGPGWPKNRVLEKFTELRENSPGLAGIMVSSEYSTELRRQAAETGFSGVYGIPLDGTELLMCLKNISALGNRGGQKKIKTGRVITVFSTKGGVGKTVIATNLAVSLAEQTKASVALVDLDLQFGDVAVMLKLMPTHTIYDLVGLKSVDIGQIKALLTKYNERVSAFVAPLQPELGDLVTPEIVKPVFGWLRQAYDYIIIDTPPSFNDNVLSVLDETDDLYLVSALDLPSLKNIKLCLQTLKLLDFDRDKVKLALNRVDKNLGLSPAEVEDVLKERIPIQVPNDPAVAIAVNKGAPVVVESPKSPAAKALFKLSEGIAKDRPVGKQGKVA
jgi:pilus assembly protein CpaE